MSGASEQIRVRVVVIGRVQGVHFRETTRKWAVEHQVTGWIRNLPDDRTVEAILEGSRHKVDAVVQAMRIGPRAARVEHLVSEEGSFTGEFSDFRVLRI